MTPMPTKTQIMWATGRPLFILRRTCIAALITWAFISIAPSLAASTDFWTIVYAGKLILISFICGHFVSALCGTFILGPIQLSKAKENGYPFRPGDRVYVIAGRDAGTIAAVYDTWRNDGIRIDIGERRKEHLEDIFYPINLLLVERYAESLGASTGEASSNDDSKAT